MALEDIVKRAAPFIAANPFDQPLYRMNCPHGSVLRSSRAKSPIKIRKENQ
jgi:hypothetical protein